MQARACKAALVGWLDDLQFMVLKQSAWRSKSSHIPFCFFLLARLEEGVTHKQHPFLMN